ncbi:MAG: alpha/beta hydrolase [Chloroflexota bacterium]
MMTKKTPKHAANIQGLTRLTTAATVGLTDLVEALHHTVTRNPETLSTPTPSTVHQVYESIRNMTNLGGKETEALLASLVPLLDTQHTSPEQDVIRAALNGALGDYLAATNNPLAVSMHLRYEGHALDLAPTSLVTALPQPRRTIILFVHGLCLTDQHWEWQGYDYGTLLATDLGATAIYLQYNTGLHISTNGRKLADILETLHHNWPVPLDNIIIIGHSMGGLVTRGACHYGAVAQHTWLRCLRQIIFLGTPHHGAPLERYAHEVQRLLDSNPYTTPFAQLGSLRSDGITDLGYGNLVDEDWSTPSRPMSMGDQRHPVPLPRGVQCYAIGATTGYTVGDLGDYLLGDGLVPLQSALGHHHDPRHMLLFPESHQWIGYTMHHMDLLHRHEVYTQMRYWLAGVL